MLEAGVRPLSDPEYTGLRLDIDRYLTYYNTDRAHTGRWTKGPDPRRGHREGEDVVSQELMRRQNSGTDNLDLGAMRVTRHLRISHTLASGVAETRLRRELKGRSRWLPVTIRTQHGLM